MGLFSNFHDACLREVHVVTGHYVDPELSMHVDWRTTVHMLIQRQNANLSAMELRFEEVVELRVVPPSPDCENIIFDAAFFLRDGVYYWADDADWAPESHREGTTWIASRKVYWRNASEWIGPDIRYGKAR
jgi:hypothetical protein